MLVADFDYNLPKELIAQQPLARRDASRMLVLERETGKVHDAMFSDMDLNLREMGVGDLSVGGLVAFLGLLGNFGYPVFMGTFAFNVVQLGFAGADRILGMLREETDLANRKEEQATEAGPGEIVSPGGARICAEESGCETNLPGKAGWIGFCPSGF